MVMNMGTRVTMLVMIFVFRNGRIKAALGQGVAAQDAPDAFIESYEETVVLETFQGVLRTRRVEATTGPQKRGDESLVQPNQKNEYELHVDFPNRPAFLKSFLRDSTRRAKSCRSKPLDGNNAT